MLRLFLENRKIGLCRSNTYRGSGSGLAKARPYLFIWIVVGSILLSFCGCSVVDEAFDEVEDGLVSTIIGTPKEVKGVSADRIGYQNLKPKGQKAYDQIVDCILTHEEKATLSITDPKICDRAFSAVMADYGGLFWVSGYSYQTYGKGDETIGFVFEPSYTMTQDERIQTQEKIDRVVENWLSDLPADADDYQKAKFVFETLIDRVDYDRKSDNNQNIISVFLGNETVCQGYANATNYLLWQLGIPAITVTGDAKNESHAWNVIELDGEYYCMDTTWGNSMYLDLDKNKVKHINYAYLNVTSEELFVTHTPDNKLHIPEATGTKDNYFRREGLYFDTWDEEAIGVALSNDYYDQNPMVSLKFSNAGLYHQARHFFIDEGHLADYCEGLDSVTYMESEDTLVLTVEYPF